MRKIETYDWWPELLGLKDALSLRELAERFNVTPGAISAAFKRTGTVRKPAPPGPRALRRRRPDGAEEDPFERDGEFDAEGGSDEQPRPRPSSKDQSILDQFELLGEVPDAEVARRAGVSVRTIASFRARHRIPGYSGPRRTANMRGPRQSKIDPFSDLLGKVPDRVVAERAGVSLNAVRNYRVKRGISAAGRAGSLAPVPATGAKAWKVLIRAGGLETERVVVADGLVQAAAMAEQASPGQVIGIELVGDVLGVLGETPPRGVSPTST